MKPAGTNSFRSSAPVFSTISKISVYFLALLMPLSFGWPLGQAVSARVLPYYATPYLLVTDVPLIIAILFGLPVLSKLSIKKNGIFLSLAGIVLLGWLTAPFSRYPSFAAYVALRWLLSLILFLVVRNGKATSHMIISSLVFGLALQTVIGAGQFAFRGPLGLPGELAQPAGVGGAAIIETSGGRILRAYGMTFHPNVLGGFLAAGLISFLPHTGTWLRRGIWWLLVVGLFLTFSRSAWLATFVILSFLATIVLFRYRDVLRRTCVLLSGAAVIVLLGVFLLREPLQTRLLLKPMETERRSIQHRVELSNVTLDIISENTLFGVGPGQYPLEVEQNYAGINPDPVHNVVLLLSAEVGVLGGLLWLTLFLVALGRFINVPNQQTLEGYSLLGACLAFGIISLFDFYPWWLESGRLLLVTMYALLDREILANTADAHAGLPTT